MQSQKRYKIISIFLMLVFSLNTFAGFACSVGINLGYNSKHHGENIKERNAPEKPHSHNTSHTHNKSNSPKKAHLHHEEMQHQHHEAGKKSNSEESGDDCCAKDVTTFIQLDKTLVTNHLLLQAPVFLLAFTSVFILPVQILYFSGAASFFQFVRRSCSLNDTDIRIAIQSFQI